MSKTAYSRTRRSLDKSMAHYKAKPSRRNWKRFLKAVRRYAAV